MKLFVIEPIFPSSVEKKRNLMEKVKQQQLGKKKKRNQNQKKKYQRRKEEYCVFTPQSISRDRGRR